MPSSRALVSLLPGFSPLDNYFGGSLDAFEKAATGGFDFTTLSVGFPQQGHRFGIRLGA